MNYGSNMNYATNTNAFSNYDNMTAKFNTGINPVNQGMGMNPNIPIMQNRQMQFNSNIQMQANQSSTTTSNMPTNFNAQLNQNAYGKQIMQVNPQINLNNPPLSNFQSSNMNFNQFKPSIQNNQEQINVNQFITAPISQSFQSKQQLQHQPLINQSQQFQRPIIKERLYLKLTSEER